MDYRRNVSIINDWDSDTTPLFFYRRNGRLDGKVCAILQLKLVNCSFECQRGLTGLLTIGLLGKKDGFIRSIRRLLSSFSLPDTYSSSDESEDYKRDLSQKHSILKRGLSIFIGSCGFALCTLFGVLILQRGAEDGDARLVMQCLLFFVVAIVGQGSVFLVLGGLWGH